MRNLDQRDKAKLEEMFLNGLDSVSDDRVEQALVSADRKITRLEDTGIPDSLLLLWKDIRLLFSMVSDSIRGRYRVPYRTIGAVAFTLVYFANPFDLIPDIIPFAGYIDDAFLVSLCVKFIGTDLEKYRNWILAHSIAEDPGHDN